MKPKIIITIIALLVLLLNLAGCESAQTVRESAHAHRVAIHAHRVAYCSETADSLVKKAAITAIKTQAPLYPTEGICIGIEEE